MTPMRFTTYVLSLAVALMALAPQQSQDRFAWLENISSSRSLAWVDAQNARTVRMLSADQHFEPFYRRALALANRQVTIPGSSVDFSSIHDGWFYDFHQDAKHPRGVWRRTTLTSFVNNRPHWQALFDLDSLARADGKPLVYGGMSNCFGNRCLISLSLGGGQSLALREFDLKTAAFVKDGFVLPAGSGAVHGALEESRYLAARPAVFAP